MSSLSSVLEIMDQDEEPDNRFISADDLMHLAREASRDQAVSDRVTTATYSNRAVPGGSTRRGCY